ncbi:MAG: virulence RhuM family protein [Barnesiella sp.]|nr:virulence RhuM family protein [Barnesiella sp.]
MRRVTYYNIEVIISLVYRIRSVIVTHLHWWAAKRLKKYFLLQRPSVTV